MTRKVNSNSSTPLTPYAEERDATELEPLKIDGDEIVLFALPHLNAKRRPAITLGKSPRTGRLQLHFRVYLKNGTAKFDRFSMTQQGCSVSPREFWKVVRKLDELSEILPELRAERDAETGDAA